MFSPTWKENGEDFAHPELLHLPDADNAPSNLISVPVRRRRREPRGPAPYVYDVLSLGNLRRSPRITTTHCGTRTSNAGHVFNEADEGIEATETSSRSIMAPYGR